MLDQVFLYWTKHTTCIIHDTNDHRRGRLLEINVYRRSNNTCYACIAEISYRVPGRNKSQLCSNLIVFCFFVFRLFVVGFVCLMFFFLFLTGTCPDTPRELSFFQFKLNFLWALQFGLVNSKPRLSISYLCSKLTTRSIPIFSTDTLGLDA